MKWNSYLDRIPNEKKSPHFYSQYYRLFEERKEGRGICFVGEEKDKVILYPTLINSINELGFELDRECYDLQGAYGYNGPVSNCDDADFLAEFSRSLLEHHQKYGIVAEFIRFCPVIQNQEYIRYIEPVYTLDNVLLDLSGGIEHLWKNSFDNGVRKAIRKSMKAKLAFKCIPGKDVSDQDVDRFLVIYNETMTRNEAGGYYFFSKIFLLQLFANLPENTLLAFVLLDDQLISAELVLLNSQNSYGFLGGTLSEHYHLNPNSFLRHELLRYLIDLGIRYYSIGGGKVRGDSIYLYKKSFSKNIDSRFYIGKYVHNQAMYDAIVTMWLQKFPGKSSLFENILLRYRC